MRYSYNGKMYASENEETIEKQENMSKSYIMLNRKKKSQEDIHKASMYLNIKKGKVILFRAVTLHSKTIKYSKDEITLKIWKLVISGEVRGL